MDGGDSNPKTQAVKTTTTDVTTSTTTLSSSSSSSSACLTTAGSARTTSVAQYYFQRRFDGTKRRHDLLEKLSQRTTPTQSPKEGVQVVTRAAGPQIPDPCAPNDSDSNKLPAPKLKPIHMVTTRARTKTRTLETDDAGSEKKFEDDEVYCNKKEQGTPERIQQSNIRPSQQRLTVDVDLSSSPYTPPAPKRQPLHIQNENYESTETSLPTNELRYYRIVYRGVVALLAESSSENDVKKSGVYLSYGEIFVSGSERLVEDPTALVQTPTRKKHPSSRLGSAVSTPILSQVWEQQEQQQQCMSTNPISPLQSLVSGTGSVSSIDTVRTTSTIMQQQQLFNTDAASIVTATTTTTTATTPVPPTKRMRMLIRVDRVLTGGYAVDATDSSSACSARTSSVESSVKAHAMTPKRGNTHFHALPSHGGAIIAGPAPVPISDMSPSTHTVVGTAASETNNLTDTPKSPLTVNPTTSNNTPHGYIFSEQCHIPIAIPLQVVPRCEQGSFRYRVVSSTPVPILTGPCLDAPRTKAILIPGTIHEVCLKVTESAATADESNEVRLDAKNGIIFLRLTRRRGWVADRKLSKGKHSDANTGSTIYTESQNCWIVTMKEMSESDGEEGSVSSRVTTGTIASEVGTPVSGAFSRHRPPRRKRGFAKSVIEPGSLPRHVMGPTISHARQGAPNDTHTMTDNSILMNSSSVSYNDPQAIVSPSSNISLLSDESSSLDPVNKSYGVGPVTPDRSVAISVASATSNCPSYFLMRVNAPRGLKILDAPHFQVNSLIHGSHTNATGGSGGTNTTSYSPMEESVAHGCNQSIFQTMSGHHTTTMTSKIRNPAVFDYITKGRKLPRGTVFEASKRMEASNAFSQGAGLIKLSDNSGWAIVPRQQELDDQYRTSSGALAHTREGEATRAYEEVGNALIDERHSTVFLRVLPKAGVSVSLPPLPSSESDVETSPTSSTTGSSAVSGANSTLQGQILSQDSDVASSVGSSFLDAMFRTPTKKNRESELHDHRRDSHASSHHSIAPLGRPPVAERPVVSTVIPCGMCVEVERWVDPPDTEHHAMRNEFARLRGGQGWIPRYVNRKPVVETVSPPEFVFGSFWFQVLDDKGIKVRLGPSRRAPSIKSDDGVYFRFECGEYLRASEIVTFFRRNSTTECFAKLYRNRHARLHTGHGEVRTLASLTVQAEWVQVLGDGELYLQECTAEPRIERHRQGWRYNVVLDARISVRKGPSFASETVGVVLLGGESVLINERVTGPDDSITWLRLMDGKGWVHNYGPKGESLMIPHSLRHRNKTVGGQSGRPGRDGDDIAYNTIIARLFHNDVPGDQSPSKDSNRGSSYRGISRR